MSDLITSHPGQPSPARVYLATLAPSGRKAVAWQLRQVAMTITGREDIDAVPWEHLNRQGVIAILETMRRRGFATSTINHCLSILKRVAEEAWSMGMIDAEAYHRIAKVRRQSGSQLPAGRSPSRQEVRQAIEAARRGRHLRDLRDAALIATMAGAGLRCFELTGLHTADYREGRLLLTGKGGKQALQPISPSGVEVLEEYLTALPHRTDPLFVHWRRYDSPGEGGLTEGGVRVVLNRWFTNLSPHDLRRGYATWLAEDGHELPVIQRLMRHANPATTVTYIRNEEGLLSASEALRF